MNIRYRLLRIVYQFRRGIWTKGSVSFDRAHWKTYVAQRLYMVFHGLFLKDHWMSAAQLTFNTLMAIIPVFAIVYAVASGFGFGDIITAEIQKAFASQPKIGDAIVTLAKNYINYTHTGVVLGISFVFMLYSVLSLFNNVEAVFNQIWGTKDTRSISRVVVDYTSMLFIVPIIVILFSGLSIFFYSIVDSLPSFQILTPFVKGVVQTVVPLAILTGFFMAMYLYFPNTKVRMGYVVIPSLMAAVAVILLQMVYVHFQVLFASYSIIYGSLAALPLLMLWLQISWYIAIGFAELAHANQEIGNGNLYQDREQSFDARLRDCTVILSLLCQRQKRGGAPMTIAELLAETHINYKSLRRSLRMLASARLIHADLTDKNDGSDMIVLRRDGSSLKLGEMYDALLKTPAVHSASRSPWRMTEKVRKDIKRLRHEYISGLNEIGIADCCIKK